MMNTAPSGNVQRSVSENPFNILTIKAIICHISAGVSGH